MTAELMIGGTNACSGNGGGDTIFLPNESGTTITAGDKVLFTLGTVGTDTPDEFTVDIPSASYFNPVCMLDDNSFVIASSSGAKRAYLFSKVNNEWVQSASTNTFWGAGYQAVYQYYKSGEAYYHWSGTGNFVTSSGLTPACGSASYYYIGEWNDNAYIMRSNNNVCLWDKTNNTYSDLLTISSWGYSAQNFNRIFGDRFITCNGTSYKIYTLSGNTTFTLLSEGSITSATKIVNMTGLATGDLAFVVDNYTNAYTEYGGNLGVSHLYCYQVQSDGSLLQIHHPMLETFETTACYVAYDNRSKILAVSTNANAYFFEFDTTNKTFSQINVSLSSLPASYNNHPYKVAMSPDKSTVVVFARNSSADIVNVYTLTTAHHRIVPNSAYYYNLAQSYTGFATGETDNNGNYEIKTVLPQV